MRITPDILQKIARDTSSERSKSDRDIMVIYQSGSLVSGDPVLGGTADIDLFFVHNSLPGETREIIRLTDDVHLDIAHHPRSLYRHAKELRLDPWMGYTVYGCKLLYDPQHFMDFTQASVRAQFNQPDNIYQRARSQVDHARQLWFSFEQSPAHTDISSVLRYLAAVQHAANAIGCLSGPILPLRRFLQYFRTRAEAAGKPGLYNGLLGLLGGNSTNPEFLKGAINDWTAAFKGIPDGQRPPSLHLARLNYYQKAFLALLESNHPADLLWPLLITWTETVALLPTGSPACDAWQTGLEHLELWGEKSSEKTSALDAFLDTVEEHLEGWAIRNGLTPNA
jgi:hypothetical protein